MPPSDRLPFQIQALGNAVLDLIFPPKCVSCKRLGEGYLCTTCIESFSPIGDAVCPVCGDPGAAGDLCFRCQQQHPAFERVRSGFRFEGAVQQAVHGLKYEGLKQLAYPLSQALVSVMEQPAASTLLCAVPLHPHRLAERGYNQARLLTDALSGYWQMPVLPVDALTRTRHTASQVGLDYPSRQANVQDAFAASPEQVHGRDILLVDDVCTTGATLNACAVALLTAGAKQVDGITLARAI